MSQPTDPAKAGKGHLDDFEEARQEVFRNGLDEVNRTTLKALRERFPEVVIDKDKDIRLPFVLVGEKTVEEESNTCPVCGTELIIGSYPFCKGNPSDHDTVRTRMAQAFQGTVYFQNQNGEIRFPPSPNSIPPKGFERKQLTTLRAADTFCREQNNRERERAEEANHNEKRYWSEVYRQGAENLQQMLSEGKLTGDRAVYAEDAIRKMRNYQGKKVQDPNFHIEPLVYDSSNRDSWSGPETGWKERKE